MIGTYFLMEFIGYSGAYYPSAIPTIMIISSILELIGLLVVFLPNMDAETPIAIKHTIFRILAVAVMWGLVNFVIFLIVSFFVMIGN